VIPYEEPPPLSRPEGARSFGIWLPVITPGLITGLLCGPGWGHIPQAVPERSVAAASTAAATAHDTAHRCYAAAAATASSLADHHCSDRTLPRNLFYVGQERIRAHCAACSVNRLLSSLLA
jgi:hypothetical protein